MVMTLKQLVLTSGPAIEVADGLTAIVGPNNVGKSLLLREFHSQLINQPGVPFNPPPKVFDRYAMDFHGSVEDFLATLRDKGYERAPGQYPQGGFGEVHYLLPPANNVLQQSQARQWWGSQNGMSGLGSYLALYLNAEGRLGMTGTTSSFNTLTERPTNPVQRLYVDRELERRISDLMQRAFGESLTVNRYVGSQITLHVGTVSAEETKPPISDDYLQELSLLPQLHEQGDGIRAFVGMLLTIMAAEYPLVLIDEPEAFLHPPQAYLLGQVLAEQHDSGTQAVVATHSTDIISGITSVKAASGNVSIARLTRTGTANHVAQISPATVGELHKDPLIRYYSILDGLFAQGVILCEADSDCTYYRAVLESIGTIGEDGLKPSALSIHFTHCGGKARMARAVRALQDAKVPVVCAVDIDFLQNDKEFTELVTAYGGDPGSFTSLRNVVKNAVDAWASKVERVGTSAKLTEILEKSKAKELSSSEATKIKEAVSAQSGWKHFKLHGAGNLSGDAVAAFDSLDKELRTLSMFMVRCGELERFHREISGDNKAEWLRKVLEGGKYLESVEAREFVQAMATAIRSAQ